MSQASYDVEQRDESVAAGCDDVKKKWVTPKLSKAAVAEETAFGFDNARSEQFDEIVYKNGS